MLLSLAEAADFFVDNPEHDFSRNEFMDDIWLAERTLYEYLPGLVGVGAVIVSKRIGRAELWSLKKFC